MAPCSSVYLTASTLIDRRSDPTLSLRKCTLFYRCSLDATSSRAGCGWIFISQQDEHLHQGTTTFENTSSSLVPEALTIRSALLNALEAGFTRICIKKNCQALVALINSKNHPKDLYRIYRDIEHLSLSFYRIAFSYVSRNLNSLADSLAKSALYLTTTNYSYLGCSFNICYVCVKKKSNLHSGLCIILKVLFHKKDNN